MVKRKAQRGDGARRKVHLLLPFSEAEKGALKHRAVDARCSLRELIRKDLGLPAKVEATVSYKQQRPSWPGGRRSCISMEHAVHR